MRELELRVTFTYNLRLNSRLHQIRSAWKVSKYSRMEDKNMYVNTVDKASDSVSIHLCFNVCYLSLRASITVKNFLLLTFIYYAYY